MTKTSKRVLCALTVLMLALTLVPFAAAAPTAGLDFLNLGTFQNLENLNNGNTHTISVADKGTGKLFTHATGVGVYWPSIHAGTNAPLTIKAADLDKYTLVWDFTVSSSGAISLWTIPPEDALAGQTEKGTAHITMNDYLMPAPTVEEPANDFTKGDYKGQANFKEFLTRVGYTGGDFAVAGMRLFVVGDINATVEVRALYLTADDIGGTTVAPSKPPSSGNAKTSDSSPIYFVLLGIGLLLAVVVVLPKARKN